MAITLECAEFCVSHYNLATTLSCGQAFRWKKVGDAWEGVVGSHWVRLHQTPNGLRAEAIEPRDWQWLREYLQVDVDLAEIVATFPQDETMKAANLFCHGMRLLRQDPWQCVASFICSSTKQIVQIQQIIELLCRNFGDPVAVPENVPPVNAFPTVGKIAELPESALRNCKMGFRAPYLAATARALAAGKMDLASLYNLPIEEARAALVELPGVGIKIADCVLLFAYGFPKAFPVDVWIARALRELYFPKRRPKPPRLLHFSQTYFGPHSGYAQQYLFHYVRTTARGRPRPRRSK